VLVAATGVFAARSGWWDRGRGSAPGGLVVGGGRWGRRSGHSGRLRSWRREEKGAVVTVLVQVGVAPPRLR